MGTDVISEIIDRRAVAILRHVPLASFDAVAEALCAGGIEIIEISLAYDDAVECIRTLVRTYKSRVIVGVGTVLSVQDYRQSVDLGADFVVTPHVIPEVMHAQAAVGVKVIAGAFTPAETAAARALGSEVVKLFPAAAGGPNYIKLLLGPYPDLKLLPTGGVTPDNAGDYLRAGAAAVGITSPLTHGDNGLLDPAEITERARKFVTAVRTR